MQHRQLTAFNKHKTQELLSHRNCCTASNSSPTAVGTAQTPEESTGSATFPAGHQTHCRILLQVPPTPTFLCPALFAHEFPSKRCDRHQRSSAAPIPLGCLRSRDCSRESEQGAGSSWKTLLSARTSKPGHRGERGAEKLGVQEVERQGKGSRDTAVGRGACWTRWTGTGWQGGDALCLFQLPPWDQ